MNRYVKCYECMKGKRGKETCAIYERDGGCRTGIPYQHEDCLIEGCEKKVRSRGYCVGHYARLLRNGDPNVVLSMRNKPKDLICSIEGCNAKERAKGYCWKHHQRWYRHGDPLLVHGRRSVD